MNAAISQARTPEATAACGGAMDAMGGIATAVLAIIGLAGWRPELLAGDVELSRRRSVQR